MVCWLASHFNSTPPLVGYRRAIDVYFLFDCFIASLVLGVPTVKRESQSYLLPTLQSLIESMSDHEKNMSLIVVFIAEVGWIGANRRREHYIIFRMVAGPQS